MRSRCAGTECEPAENGFAHTYQVGAGAESNYFKVSATREDGLPVEQTPDYYATTAIAEHAVRTLRAHAREHAGTPFFQYIAFTAPHFPLQAPAADIAKYRGRYAPGWNAVAQARHGRLSEMGIIKHSLPPMEREVGPPYAFADVLAKMGPDEVNRPVPWEELSPSQRDFQAEKMAIHAAMVDRMDREIGRVLDQIRAMGDFENTLIFFASDNGASAEMMIRGDGHDRNAPLGSASTFPCLGPGWSSASNTPFRRHKTWVHEGGIATPLVVHWPAGIRAPGELRHRPGHLIDVVPTLLEVSGAVKPAQIGTLQVPPAPGRSLVSAFEKDDPTLPGYLWWNHEKHRAIRCGDWKLVALAVGEWELYDLSKDRGELNNLAAKEPDRVRELESLWNRHAEETLQLARSERAP